MKIKLDPKKSLHENAAVYFEKAKKARQKRESLIVAMKDMEAKIAEAEKGAAAEKAENAPKMIEKSAEKKEWFERFHHFTTPNGRLCLAGHDASQNEVLVKNYFDDGDLFFHADVQGAAATILKDGVKASPDEKAGAAQFAASYSKAWKGGFATVDVYAVGHDQVSKTAQSGEYVSKGGFIIRGKREWFKNTPLKVAIGFSGEKLIVVPNLLAQTLQKRVELTPAEKTENAAKALKTLSLPATRRDEVMRLLP
jgi:predicted ribosome quality control (RQC) complex YloA/Tae2 family protein